MTRSRPIRMVALAVALSAGSAACGIGAQRAAQVDAAENVPFDLLDPEAPALVQPAGGEDVTVCLVGDGVITPTPRRLPSDASMLEIVQSLASDVTDAEAAAGLHSALTSDVAIAATTVRRGTAVVDFGAAPDLIGEDRIVAVAQIVCTLLHQAGIGQVTFTVEGAPIQVPVGDGSLTAEPVTRDDYPSLLG